VKESGLSHKAIRIHYPLYGVTIVALVSAVLLTSQVVVKAARVESSPFTALSIVSLAAKAGDGHVRVVIENQENKAVVYRLELLRGGDLLEEWESIALGQHEQWALDLSSSQLVGETSFRLFVQGEGQPYRQIHLTAGQSATDGSR
jgi:hypothetical protein